MRPTIGNYRVIKDGDWFAVQHKYDLLTGNHWHTDGARYKDLMGASDWLIELHEIHLKEYERLKQMGLSFPDNS